MKAHNTNTELSEIKAEDQVGFIQQPQNLLNSDLNSLSKALIMMLDDESITMEIMQTYLEDEGYENFVLLEDSTQALDVIEQKRPDLLLLDLVMPKVNGFTILEQIRNHPTNSHLPVIVLTSSTEAETKIKALEGGATDFLAKPVDPSELKLRVRNTIAAKAYQDQLAYYDALTKLPNKSLFIDRLNWAIEQAGRHDKKLVLLHIFFNQFKKIHDAFGYEAGDNIIKQIATRINECIRDYDLVVHKKETVDNNNGGLFRIGSEEFSLLCLEITHPAYAATIATRILECMKSPFNANGTMVNIMPNIGIATFPEDAKDMVSLMQASVSASYNLSEKSGGQFQFYSEDLNTESYNRLQIETELRNAISKNEFMLYFQPKVDVHSGKILGAEALIRWKKADGAFVRPDKFIPIAEDSDLIVPLGRWVIQEACRHLAHLQANNIFLNLSVNISFTQFQMDNIFTLINNIKQKTNVDLSYLTVELTERMLMENPKNTAKILNKLISLGIKISVDDFGTGYSALSYLRQFPLHELKIDQSFIRNIQANEDDLILVSAIIDLARTFKLKVVAEGVEEESQLKILQELNCDEYQGFYFSKPVPFKDFGKIYIKN